MKKITLPVTQFLAGCGVDFKFYILNDKVGVKISDYPTKVKRARRVQVFLARYELAPKVSRRLYTVEHGKVSKVGFVTETVDDEATKDLPKKLYFLGDTHGGNVREKNGRTIVIDTGYHLIGTETGYEWEKRFRKFKKKVARAYPLKKLQKPYLEEY